MPFDNAKKQSARKALGQTKQPSNFGSTISDQLRFVRQEVHHDLGLALQRCLIVAKRDRELFRTRVLYFDSEATHKQRFTPPPKAKVGKQKNPAGQPRTHPSIMRGMPDYDSESSDSEGNVDTEHRSSSDSQDESSDSDLGETADLPDATSTDHRFFDPAQGPRNAVWQNDDAVAAHVARVVPDTETIIQEYRAIQSRAVPWPPDALLQKLQPADRARFGHTLIEMQSFRRAVPWLASFRKSGATVTCTSAVHAEQRRNLDQRRGCGAGKCGSSFPMTLRRCVMEDATDAFHCDALLGLGAVYNPYCASQREKEECARRLYRHFTKPQGVLASQTWCPSTFEGAPAELTERITEAQFVQQYQRLQALAKDLLGEADSNMPSRIRGVSTTSVALYSFEGLDIFFEGIGIRLVNLEAVSVDGATSEDAFASARNAVKSLRAGKACASEIARLRGLLVTVKSYGLGCVVGARFALNDNNMQAVLMTLPYEVVQTRGVWHVLRVYHRTGLASSAMEMICESVGSELRYLERRNIVGRDVLLSNLVAGTRVRFAGFRGTLADYVGIFIALCHHFKTSSPQDFHFSRRRRQRASIKLDENRQFGTSCTLSRHRVRAFQRKIKLSWHANALLDAIEQKPGRQIRDAVPAHVWEDLDRVMRNAGMPLQAVAFKT